MFGCIRSPKEIVFGRGQRYYAPAAASRFGGKVLVCTDERMATQPDFSQLIDAFRHKDLTLEIYSGAKPEVPLSCIHEGVNVARTFAPDVVVGIGGGSCIDLSKVIAFLLHEDRALEDFYGEFKVTRSTKPLIAMPTTAGTGSEVTPVAVVADPRREIKVGIASPHLIPSVAICDPDLTDTCPPGLTAASGADALTHAVEAFTARRRDVEPTLAAASVFVGKNNLSDVAALEAISLIGRNLAIAVTDGGNKLARDAMMMGSLLAGLAFSTAGTAAAHAIQYPVGALTHTPHGVGVACILPHVMKFNLPTRVEEFAQIGRILGASESGSAEQMAQESIDRVASLFAAIGIPSSLSKLGVRAQDVDRIAELTMQAARLVNNNPVALSVADIRSLVGTALN